MTIKEYQEISLLDSGSTTYEKDLANIFSIDLDENINEVRGDILKSLQFKEYTLGKRIWFNGRYWKWEKDLLDQTFSQWVRLDQMLSLGDNIKNLHKLIAIYFRPCNYFGKIRKYNEREQEELSEQLLESDYVKAQSLMVFFYLNVKQSMNYIKIPFLNRLNKKQS